LIRFVGKKGPSVGDTDFKTKYCYKVGELKPRGQWSSPVGKLPINLRVQLSPVTHADTVYLCNQKCDKEDDVTKASSVNA
jgi:hypothetical protein